MIITEEMTKDFPLIPEEELKEIRVPKEELIERAIREFNIEADKIDSEYENWTDEQWWDFFSKEGMLTHEEFCDCLDKIIEDVYGD